MYRVISATMLHLISPRMLHKISARMYHHRSGEKTPKETYFNPTKKKKPDHWVTRSLDGNRRAFLFFPLEKFLG